MYEGERRTEGNCPHPIFQHGHLSVPHTTPWVTAEPRWLGGRRRCLACLRILLLLLLLLLLPLLLLLIIIAVISIAPYLTDKGEETVLSKYAWV